MKRALLTIAFLALTLVASAGEKEQTEVFRQANAAYDSGDFNQAVELYNSIVDSGFDSWELRYNLGNAHYRLDNIGLAILNYERALRFAPSKQIIKDNLTLARSHTVDNIDELPRLFLIEWAQAVAQSMTLSGWLTLFVILALLTCATVSAFLIAKDYKIRKIIFIIGSIVLLLLVFSIVNATISVHNASKDNEAIITAPLIVVKGSPDAKSVDKFVLHEGTKVTINDSQDDWWQIEIADGKSGWINRGAEKI